MAEENKKLVATAIKTYYQFKKDKSKNKRISIGLFQSTMNFKITSANEAGKLNDKPDVDVYFKSLAYNEELLLSGVNEILARLKHLHKKGTSLESNPIIYHNGKPDYASSTNMMTLDCYSKEDKVITLITLKRRPENSEKWTESATMYFSNTALVPGLYYKGENFEYTEAYSFFNSLAKILEAFVNRTSPKRDSHWQEVLKEITPNNNFKTATPAKQQSSSSTKIEEIDEDDDYLF